jgi:hypothetical protein
MGQTLESGTISGGLKQLAENVGRSSDSGPNDVDDSQTDDSVDLDENQESNMLADKLRSQAAALRQQAEDAFQVRTTPPYSFVRLQLPLKRSCFSSPTSATLLLSHGISSRTN